MKKNLLFVLTTLILLLFLTEIVLTLGFWIKDRNTNMIKVDTTVDHPYTYYTFVPSAERFINADGLFSKASREKDARKLRVMLVGGSVARSNGPYDQTISYHLEEELKSRLGTDAVEVVNAGMDGFVAEQEFIFIQLVLQYYQPDVIIALDGYNDMMSFNLNRYSRLTYAPQNWRDFRVISEGKEKDKFYYRFKGLFKSTFRAADFLIQWKHGESQYDYSKVTDAELDSYAKTYINTLQDMKDFCAAKKIAFFCFLQPSAWYVPAGPEVVRYQGIPALGRLYRKYDEAYTNIPYGRSLTNIFEANQPGIYTDGVHVRDEGARIFARSIAESFEKSLVKDPNNGKPTLNPDYWNAVPTPR